MSIVPVQAIDTVQPRWDSSKAPSFSALVKERFALDIYKAAKQYCETQGVEFLSASLGRITVTNFKIASAQLDFEVLCFASLTDNGERHDITLLMSCICSLNDDFSRIHVDSTVPCLKNHRTKPGLPDDLVPIIQKKNLDQVAINILNALHICPNNGTMPVNGVAVAKSLGLHVEKCEFDPRENVFGKVFFDDAMTIVKDSNTGLATIKPIKKGTILVNESPFGCTDSHILNNTILHECVHWLLHRPAFQLAKVWNKEYAATACRKLKVDSSTHKWTSLERMEWQANSLAPRLLMPDWVTKFIANEWLSRYEQLSSNLRMERTIDQLCRFFDVSRQMAKIRMKELGFEGAEGAFAYYETRRYNIGFDNAVREASRNPRFWKAIASGHYTYVENCFVVRDRKYICRDQDGVLRLTTYAKSHPDECCLSFALQRSTQSMPNGMLRKRLNDEVFIAGSELSSKQFERSAKAIAAISKSLPNSFADTLAAHMKRKGISVEQLEESSLVSDRQIVRYRNEENPYISLQSVICLCIGMRLHPVFAFDLIRKAGFSLNDSIEHTAYKIILTSMTTNSVRECNDYLRQMGINPISREE